MTRDTSEWRSRYPELGTDPLSIEPIVSSELFEIERERIFKCVWHKVGRVEEISEPGCFKVKRIDFAQTSVILFRGKDDGIRAFHNVCPHRGNQVIPQVDNETFGKARGDYVTCRFHGWVFDTKGEVRDVPSLEKFPPYFEQCDYGLKPVACDVWEGFIFINLAPEPRQSLLEYLDGMATHFSGWPYHEGTAHYRYSSVFNCNWKIALNAFTEAYHVETIHANTLPWYAKIDQENLTFYGPHRTSGLHLRIVEGAEIPAPAPVDGLALRIMQSSPHQCFDADKLPPKINPKRRENFLFELPTFFPNFMIHVYSGGGGDPGMLFFTHQFWPLAVDRTLWETTRYWRAATNASEYFATAYANAIHRIAQLEDTATMEDTFAGLQTGVIDLMPLMDDEVMLRHQDLVWREYMGLE